MQQLSKLNSDIHALNLSYLMCLRELAKVDPSEASVRFGVDRSMATRVAEMPVDKIQTLANPTMLQFSMRANNQVRSIMNGDESASLRSVMSMLGEASNDSEWRDE